MKIKPKIKQVIRFTIYFTAAVSAVSFAVLSFGLIYSVRLIGSQDLPYSETGNSRNPFAFALRVPQQQTKSSSIPYVPIEGELTKGELYGDFNNISKNISKAALTGSWSNFRGDSFDAIYRPEKNNSDNKNNSGNIRIKKTFSEADKPPQCWSLPLGEGFAGPAVRNGKVYLLDYDMENYRDALRCLSFETGKEIWRYSYPVKIKKNHGMSRTIPAVSDRYCVSLGPKCHVLCTDAASGEKKWFIDLQHTFGTTEPEWYAGQCPFIVNEKDGSESVIIAPAGPEVLMFSLDCETGKERWRTPNPFNWTMTHASIMPMKLNDGRNTFVYFGKGGAAGIDAESGNILWSTEDWRIEIATCPSPLILPDNRIFCCGGYLSGSAMLQIDTDSAGKYQVKTLYRLKDAVFGSEQQTPVYYNGHIFGLRQRDKEFVCLSADGKLIWHSGSKGRFGSGPFILVEDEKPFFLILDDDGKLTACDASVEKYTPLFEVEVIEGHACWSPPAIAAGYLLVRSQDTMVCLNMKE